MKFKKLTLPELEAIFAVRPKNILGMIDERKDLARKVALCSTQQEFHKYIKSVFNGTYDYITH